MTEVTPEVMPQNNEVQTALVPMRELSANPEALVKAFADVEKLQSQLWPLRQEAIDAKVDSAEKYQRLGAVLTEERRLRGEGEALGKPFFGLLTKVKDFLRLRFAAHDNLCEEIEGIIKPKLKEWERTEKQATAKEQEKAPAGATVKPAIPSISGYRQSTTWHCEVTDFDAFLKEFVKVYKARDKKSHERELYLRRFLVVDAKGLNAEARRVQNNEEMEKLVPGSHAWSE